MGAMTDGFKTVFRPDGSMGIERTVGNMRFDLTDPVAQPTYIMGAGASAASVVRPDGVTATEFAFGSLRTATDRTDFDMLI